jgi:hypothetical protein
VHTPPSIVAPQSFARALLGFVEVAVDRLVVAVDEPNEGECSFMYRYILRESCSQFDSLPPNIFVDPAVDEPNEALWTYHVFAGDAAAAVTARVEAIGGDPYERAAGEAAPRAPSGKGDVQQVCACLVALKNLIESNPGVEEETASRHLPLLFQLLAPGALFEKPHPALRDAALAVITAMSRNAACAAAIAEERLLAPLFRLLRTEIDVRKRVLRVVASLCETRAVVVEVMRVWGVLELLRILVGMGGAAGGAAGGEASGAAVEDVDEHGRAALTDEGASFISRRSLLIFFCFAPYSFVCSYIFVCARAHRRRHRRPPRGAQGGGACPLENAPRAGRGTKGARAAGTRAHCCLRAPPRRRSSSPPPHLLLADVHSCPALPPLRPCPGTARIARRSRPLDRQDA